MEKIWLSSYEDGIQAEVDVTQYDSVVDVVQQSVEKFADQTAFHNMGKDVSNASQL